MSTFNVRDIPGIREIDDMIKMAQQNGDQAMAERSYSDVDKWDTMYDQLRAVRNTIAAAHAIRELENA